MRLFQENQERRVVSQSWGVGEYPVACCASGRDGPDWMWMEMGVWTANNPVEDCLAHGSLAHWLTGSLARLSPGCRPRWRKMIYVERLCQPQRRRNDFNGQASSRDRRCFVDGLALWRDSRDRSPRMQRGQRVQCPVSNVQCRWRPPEPGGVISL